MSNIKNISPVFKSERSPPTKTDRSHVMFYIQSHGANEIKNKDEGPAYP